jgi:hypothetical protein
MNKITTTIDEHQRKHLKFQKKTLMQKKLPKEYPYLTQKKFQIIMFKSF